MLKATIDDLKIKIPNLLDEIKKTNNFETINKNNIEDYRNGMYALLET